jgi:hypothetical protein
LAVGALYSQLSETNHVSWTTHSLENQTFELSGPEDVLSSFVMQKKLMKHLATVKKDGTVEFDVAGSARIANNLFGPGAFDDGGNDREEENEDSERCGKHVPPLQIVMLIVGTRGDVQPFVAIGKHLQVTYTIKS